MALAKHTQSGLQADACELCDHVHFFDPDLSREHVVETMHRHCHNCLSFDDKDLQLCSICQHWRFRHLFNCLLKSDRDQGRQGKIRKIDILMIGAYKLSKGCAFCDILYHASEIGVKSPREGNTRKFIEEYPSLSISLDEISGNIHFHPAGEPGYLMHLYPPGDVPNCVGADVQWSLVSSWLMECTEKHDKCHVQYLKQPDEIRLIDVERRKLVRAGEDCKFVALSYVWGTNRNPEKLTCTKSNVKALEQDDALKTGRIPQTIEDAFQVCKKLGENYLWVDRLCIVQDDSAQKHEQIEAMANIFSSASLVIVVLDGSMETGIPGIQPRPSKTQMQVEIANLVYMNELPPYQSLIDNSDWAKRGWTYQEAVLGKRRLYFSWAQVFFQCNTGVKEEDAAARQKRRWQFESSLTGIGWSFNKWKQHLWKYSARSLSYESDIYNAIAGISNALLPEPANWLYGLPRRDFDEALLWFNNLEQGYRASGDVSTPRWSWSSAKGQITHQAAPDGYPSNVYGWAFVETTVVWNYQEGDEASPRFVPVRDSKSMAYVRPRNDGCWLIYSQKDSPQDPNTYMTFPDGVVSNCQRTYSGSSWQSSPKLLCYGIAWSQGCIDTNWPFSAHAERTFQELGADLEKQWQEVDYLERDIVLCSSEDQQPPIPEIEMPLDRSTLKGRAQTSFFTLREAVATSKCSEFLTVIDHEGRPVGQMNKIKEERAKISLQCSASCRYQLIALGIGLFQSAENIQKTHGNFLANDPIAGCLWDEVLRYKSWMTNDLTTERISRFCEAVGPNGLDISYLDSEGSALEFIPVVHVMLPEWDGPVARRISIGWVFLTRWVKSNPQFKTVYLA